MIPSGEIGSRSAKGPILLLLPFPNMSGLELFGIRFADDLVKRGFPVIVMSPEGGLIHAECRRRALSWKPFPILFRFDPRAIRRFISVFREDRPRLCIGFRTQTLYPFHIARVISGNHVPIILFYRLGAGNQPRRDPIHRVLFHRLAAVIPNADHVKNKILSKWAIDPGKVVCIKSGIDSHRYHPDPTLGIRFRKEMEIPPEALVVGNTGRIHPEKGSMILLDALFGPGGPASTGEREVHLVYVGREHSPGYGDLLRRRAAELGRGKHFHILPFMTDVEKVYPAFDFFGLAVTSHETYAYVVLEAMSSGVIPIVPEIGGMKEMFTHGIEGFYFRHRDEISLRETLQIALNTGPEDRKRMKTAARNRILAHASWAKMMETYLDLFRKIGIDLRTIPAGAYGGNQR